MIAVTTEDLRTWLVQQIKTEAIGDRFNYGACDGWYRCGVRFGVFTETDHRDIKALLDEHRRVGPPA